MNERNDESDAPQRAQLGRRAFLKRLAGVTALAAAGLSARAAAAEDAALDALIGDTQRGEFGQSFDDASRTIHMPKASEPTVSTATAQTTEKAIDRYADIVSHGGWPQVPSVAVLRLGDRHASVGVLRTRLAASGDIDPNAAGNDIYDSYVEAAVRRFQARHGLTADGIIRAETLAAINVPAPVRLSQLKVNVVRLRALGANLSPRFVVCNIPAARIEAIENGAAVSRHTAVVGKPDRASPEINSKIIQINFNPYWTVPPSIVQKDLIPKMQDQPDYLTNNHIRIFDARHRELEPSRINWYSEDATHFSFKQDPGSFNSLGSIRINFPSAYGVYMHDTPLKNLFGDDFRFHSSGCVRVQNVRQLVAWLLEGMRGWSLEDIDRVIKSGEQKNAQLVKPVPLHWVYITGWATADGVVQFREDIYGKDGVPGAPAAGTNL
jgi:murein L,D-transpeptidase YcbB/YkuD